MCKKTYLHNTGSDWVPGIVVGQLSSNNFHFQPQTDPLYLSHREKAQLFPFSQRRVTQESLAVLRSPGLLLLTWVQQLPAVGPLSDCKSRGKGTEEEPGLAAGSSASTRQAAVLASSHL